MSDWQQQRQRDGENEFSGSGPSLSRWEEKVASRPWLVSSVLSLSAEAVTRTWGDSVAYTVPREGVPGEYGKSPAGGPEW